MRFPLCMNFTIPRDSDGTGQGVGAPAAGPGENGPDGQEGEQGPQDATADQNDATVDSYDATVDSYDDVSVVDSYETTEVDVTTVGFMANAMNALGTALGTAALGGTPGQSIGAGIGGLAGQGIGGAIGGPAGQAIGGALGAGIGMGVESTVNAIGEMNSQPGVHGVNNFGGNGAG